MRAAVYLLTGLLSLGACATGPSDVRALGPGLVKEYSPDVLDRAAVELEALPEGSALAVLVGDYAVLREQLRAAR